MVAYLKTQSVLELLDNFSNLSTVAYRGVAYKKNRVITLYLVHALDVILLAISQSQFQLIIFTECKMVWLTPFSVVNN